EELLEKLIPAVSALKTGDPTDSETDVGPLISKKDVERVHSWVEEAVQGGASVKLGGKPLDNNCYSPTVLTNLNEEMKVMAKEIFGPVLCVQPYTDLDQTIELMNRSPHSFQSAIYADDIDVALSTIKKLDTKALIVNNTT